MIDTTVNDIFEASPQIAKLKKIDNKIYVCKIMRNVLSKLYDVEN